MKNLKLLQEKDEVDNLFAQIQGYSGDPYYQSLMTYYLCVRVSGFIENCVRIILTEYSAPRAQDSVRTYVDRTVAKFPNPTFENICDLTKRFNDHWHRSFKSSIGPQTPARRALESINVNRNNIAHGGTSTITLSQLESYYRDVLHLVDELERTCI